MLIPFVTMKELREEIVISEISKVPLVVRGGPGLGKSEAMRAHAAARRKQIAESAEAEKILARVPAGSPVSKLPVEQQLYGFIDCRLSLYDPTDLKGFPSNDKEAGVSRWLPPDIFPLQSLVDKGHLPEFGIIVLEELASAPRAVQVAAFQITLDRSVNGHPLAPGWFIVATSNSLTDMSVVNAMPAPLVSRFSHVELQPLVSEWTDWATRARINHKIVSYVKWKPDALFCFDPKKWVQDTPYACPRSFHLLASKVSAFETAYPGQPIPRRLICSAVGKEIGDELFAYLDIFTKIPSVEDVCRAPMECMVPKEASATFAIIGALARAATRENLPALMTYFARLDKGYEVSAVKDVIRVNEALQDTLPYQSFLLKPENKEIFLSLRS
jgi:hypothetical protein